MNVEDDNKPIVTAENPEAVSEREDTETPEATPPQSDFDVAISEITTQQQVRFQQRRQI